jgi:hypothetical protein
LTVAVPPVGVLLIVVGAIAAARSALSEPWKRMQLLSLGAGFLLGIGAVFLYGSWNVVSACSETRDFCGNANVVPLLTAAIFALALGGTAASVSLLANRRRRP